MKADLVERASYADYLTVQAASGSGLSGSLPLKVTWSPTRDVEGGGGEGA